MQYLYQVPQCCQTTLWIVLLFAPFPEGYFVPGLYKRAKCLIVCVFCYRHRHLWIVLLHLVSYLVAAEAEQIFELQVVVRFFCGAFEWVSRVQRSIGQSFFVFVAACSICGICSGWKRSLPEAGIRLLLFTDQECVVSSDWLIDWLSKRASEWLTHCSIDRLIDWIDFAGLTWHFDSVADVSSSIAAEIYNTFSILKLSSAVQKFIIQKSSFFLSLSITRKGFSVVSRLEFAWLFDLGNVHDIRRGIILFRAYQKGWYRVQTSKRAYGWAHGSNSSYLVYDSDVFLRLRISD